jgi:hypothetical protein
MLEALEIPLKMRFSHHVSAGRDKPMTSGLPQIQWSKYRPKWIQRELPRFCRAALVKRIIVDGKPTLKRMGCLAAYQEDLVDDAETRAVFWRRARYQLGRLLPPHQITLVEEQLARRIPKPQAESALTVCRSAHPIRGPHQPLMRRWIRPLPR